VEPPDVSSLEQAAMSTRTADATMKDLRRAMRDHPSWIRPIADSDELA
jgi:hypothetical protein